MSMKILSFDPGTTITGWAYAVHNPQDGSYTVSRCGEITPIKDAKQLDKEDCKKYKTQLIALDHLYNNVFELIRKYKPEVVVSEDAFLHHRFVQAYASLSLCIHTISRAARVHGLLCERIAPKLVKKLTSESGIADKLAMLEALQENSNIRVTTKKCRESMILSDHVSDAIAVGYAYTQQIRI